MSRLLNPDVPSEMRYCDVCGCVTEHRIHRRGHRKDGSTVYRVRCRACHARRTNTHRIRLKEIDDQWERM